MIPMGPRWTHSNQRWTPHINREPALETYIQTVNEGAQKAPPRTRCDNLTRDERMSLTLLKLAKSEVVIKPADKGSATIVWSFGNYIAEANRQLKTPPNTAHLRKTPLPSIPRRSTGKYYLLESSFWSLDSGFWNLINCTCAVEYDSRGQP